MILEFLKSENTIVNDHVYRFAIENYDFQLLKLEKIESRKVAFFREKNAIFRFREKSVRLVNEMIPKF